MAASGSEATNSWPRCLDVAHRPVTVRASMVEARLRVIYGDTDQMGVVYYANYFRYFEFGRSEYFRAHGGSYTEVEKQGTRLPVIEATCHYKAPARYEDVVLIRTRIDDLGPASVTFGYEVV